MSTYFNAYAPPEISQKLLRKVQGEYIALFLPAPYLAADNYLGVELDSESNLLFKPKAPKNTILNFQDWMCAWNLFMQATLHHHPTVHVKLFTYQKIFSNLVSKYNFKSCYAYDKNQRTQIASQSTTPLAICCTVSWEFMNEELHNIFLRDSHLSACYKCKTTGHYASNCPYHHEGTQPLSFRSPSTSSSNPSS